LPEPLAVDRLEVLVLIDNLTDGLSTNPKNVIAEWAALLAAGRLPVISGDRICCAHHGLSLLITAHTGDTRSTLLFDTGPEGATLMRNARILGVDFSTIDTVVLSHGHWDHGGGLVDAITAIASARPPSPGMPRAGGSVDCFVHPGMFRRRATQRPDGGTIVHELVPDPVRLASAGANVINTDQPQVAGGGAFYISGEIPRVTPYERGLPGHVRRNEDDTAWEPDPLIMDERYLSVHVRGKGQFVFSACSHAGIVNVLTHARDAHPDVPLYGVMGGFHLSGSTEPIIPETIRDLQTFGLKFVAPGHCTGWRAVSEMAKLLSADVLVPSAVGKRYVIGD
jgi:7,8-dihydropterin-6-yl-methyl-4-(beta-D-ribofuranosyl)aminobenzene 5'-phosphate synthase